MSKLDVSNALAWYRRSSVVSRGVVFNPINAYAEFSVPV
jgi:hypothetical protein